VGHCGLQLVGEATTAAGAAPSILLEYYIVSTSFFYGAACGSARASAPPGSRDIMDLSLRQGGLCFEALRAIPYLGRERGARNAYLQRALGRRAWR
jgi:hypothetical protein